MRGVFTLLLLTGLTACGTADAEGDAPPATALTELPEAPGTRVEAALV